MDPALSTDYDIDKINDLLFKLNKYQTLLLGSKEKDKKDKYQNKIDGYISSLEKLGISMKGSNREDKKKQEGGNASTIESLDTIMADIESTIIQTDDLIDGLIN